MGGGGGGCPLAAEMRSWRRIRDRDLLHQQKLMDSVKKDPNLEKDFVQLRCKKISIKVIMKLLVHISAFILKRDIRK